MSFRSYEKAVNILSGAGITAFCLTPLTLLGFLFAVPAGIIGIMASICGMVAILSIAAIMILSK